MKFNDPTRQVVNTLEDQHKYEMPSARRLGVYADPVNQFVIPAESDAAKLAESLVHVSAKLQPMFQEHAAEKAQAEKDKGTLAREKAGTQTDEEVALAIKEQSPHFQAGYMASHGMLAAQADREKLAQAYDTSGLGTSGGDVNAWLGQQWKGLTTGMQDPNYIRAYTKQMESTFAGIREQHFKDNLAAVKGDTFAMGTKFFTDDMLHSGKWTVAMFEQRATDLMGVLGVSRAEADKMAWSAATAVGDQGHPEVYDVFKQPKSDGTPGIYFKEGMGAKVEVAKAHAESVFTGNIEKADKLAKLKREHAREDTLLSVFQKAASGDTDGANADFSKLVSDPKLKDVFNAKELYEYKTMLSSMTKREETNSNRENMAKLMPGVYEGSLGTKGILEALNSGDISPSGAQQLMGIRHQIVVENRTLANQQTAESKAIYKTPEYSAAKTLISHSLTARNSPLDKLDALGQQDRTRQGLAFARLSKFAATATPDALEGYTRELIKSELDFRKQVTKVDGKGNITLNGQDPFVLPPTRYATPAALSAARAAGKVSDEELSYHLDTWKAQGKIPK